MSNLATSNIAIPVNDVKPQIRTPTSLPAERKCAKNSLSAKPLCSRQDCQPSRCCSEWHGGQELEVARQQFVRLGCALVAQKKSSLVGVLSL